MGRLLVIYIVLSVPELDQLEWSISRQRSGESRESASAEANSGYSSVAGPSPIWAIPRPEFSDRDPLMITD